MKAPALDITIGQFDHGKRNAITDVEGVTVGHVTLIEGKGKLIPGKGPVRTGVTAIIPHEDNIYREKLMAHASILNGHSKSTGLIQVMECGVIETPLILTNTLSVGTAVEGIITHMLDRNDDIGVTTTSLNPVVMECNDSYLNDIRGRHVTTDHVITALNSARRKFKEGAVGAGTGMCAFEFKGGIGSSSRVLEIEDRSVTVGALVLSNFGKREDLTIAGFSVGKHLAHIPGRVTSEGSCIMIVATDAPLTARQLGRVARRSALGLARTGGYGYNRSGDIALSFSTAQRILHDPPGVMSFTMLPDTALNPLFKATVDTVEEAIINSLLQARTMDGRDDRVLYALPVDSLETLLKIG